MIYTIHGPSQRFGAKVSNVDEIEFSALVAVPEDLAKWALVAPPFWLAFHKLWWMFGAYCLFLAAMTGVLTTSFWPIAVCLAGLPGIYLFLEGRQLCRSRLEESGLDMIGVVDATSEEAAIARFVGHVINRQLAEPVEPPPSLGELTKWRARAGSAPENASIGLFPAKEF